MPTKKDYDLSHPDGSRKTNYLVRFYSAILTAVLTPVTFAFAIIACIKPADWKYPLLRSESADTRWMP